MLRLIYKRLGASPERLFLADYNYVEKVISNNKDASLGDLSTSFFFKFKVSAMQYGLSFLEFVGYKF